MCIRDSSKQGTFRQRHGPKLVPARRVAARIGAGRVARLGNRTTIALTGRLAITNSGCNAHAFHCVTGSKAQAILLECGGMKLNPWMYYQRSRLLALVKRDDDAISDLQAALRLDPSFARAASSLGFLYAKVGRRDLAIEQFQQALRSEPDNPVPVSYTHLTLPTSDLV